MVNGIAELQNLFGFLSRLGLTEYPSFSSEIMEYAVRYGGPNIVGYFDEDVELDDLTEEELEVMADADPTYRNWYEDKYIHSILLGDDEDEL
jgi:hypothetical protein